MQLQARQKPGNTNNKFLDLIADPFQAQIQATSIYAAIAYSFIVSTLLVILFCLLRPRVSRVYAPRAKHADEKHRPRELGTAPFGWLAAVNVKEEHLVNTIGLDAVVFLRFLRMLRNIFIVLTTIGIAILVPVNVVGGAPLYSQWHNIATLMKITPQYVYGQKFWAYVIVAYLFQATVCFFLWWNYRAVLKLRRAYFNTQEYKASLHSRTLLLTHVPKSSRTETGIADLVESAKQTSSNPRTAIGRNVKDLPKLIQSHENAVRKLEECLAEHLRNPERLPSTRPTCKVAKDDQNEYGNRKVDAIDYLTDRIKRLEATIKDVREGVDMRNPMSYGFASYAHVEDAHAVAYACRKKGPAGCDVYLAPKPNDLLWQNLSMSRQVRRTRAFWDGLWIVLITIAFIVPNILTAVFLSDFAHLGLVWPAFQTNLQTHPKGWAVAQGIVAPLVQTLLYMGVPIIFRRLFTHSGDVSKTSRERHVTARLYSFFCFNNLFIFSVFGSAWRFVAGVIAAKDQGVWQAIRNAHPFTNVMIGLCSVSTFWLTWQMQRNLGAAIDLSQAWIMIYSSIRRKWFSPTPRELIELSAPQPFPYADYYNNYLFVSTVGMCMGALQPVILPVTLFFLSTDYVFKTYLLQYVFITKTESGGRFWRLLVNRMLFAVAFGNAVIALVVGAQGVGSVNVVQNGNMLYCMIPLPFLLVVFKLYCKRAFDDKIAYYATLSHFDVEGSHPAPHAKERTIHKVGVRYGHPALYKTLLTPMVHAKSRHLLKEVYGNRSNTARELFDSHARSASGTRSASIAYGDMYMADMSHDRPGKEYLGPSLPNVEVIAESDLDFENFKKRAEFRDQFGGDGGLYGRPEDLMSSRPGTPSTLATFSDIKGTYRNRDSISSRGSSRPGSPRVRAGLENTSVEQGTSYAHGYTRPSTTTADAGFQNVSIDLSVPVTPLDADEVLRVTNSRQHLVSGAGGAGEGGNYFSQNLKGDKSYERYRYMK